MENKKVRSRADNKRKRHSEVLAAATRVFYDKGYDGTTIQDIADELGILKGSLYYYVTSKEDMLYEVLEEIHRAGVVAALRAVEVEGDPIERIRTFVSTLSEFNAQNPQEMSVLLRELHILSPERRKNIVRERDRYEEILRDLISDGQRDGLIPADIIPKITTKAIMGMVNNIYQWYKPTGGIKPAKVGAIYGDLAVRTLSNVPLASVPESTNGASTNGASTNEASAYEARTT